MAVPDRLDDLTGPGSGVVELPITLFWSRPDRTFNLDDRYQAIDMYLAVLDKGSVEELARYLNGKLLVRLWPDLHLTRAKRLAWQARFPELRTAQLIVSHPDDDPPVLVEVEIAHFDYDSAVRSPIGPVLSLDDLAGFKTAAFVPLTELSTRGRRFPGQQSRLGHFERRRLALGDCGRAWGTACIHEHNCVRCPLLRVDPAQRPRLENIRDSLRARLAEAERQGWVGDVEGLNVSLSGAKGKLAQVDNAIARRSMTVDLGIPAYRDVAGTTAVIPNRRH